MSGDQTLIHSEIDFDREGKQTGFLRLPHSVHRSAYGWIPIPIVMFKHGEGPTTLMMAGNHGDEYEGQVALAKLCCELDAEHIQGRLIILTMANYPAARAGLRTSPIVMAGVSSMKRGALLRSREASMMRESSSLVGCKPGLRLDMP